MQKRVKMVWRRVSVVMAPVRVARWWVARRMSWASRSPLRSWPMAWRARSSAAAACASACACRALVIMMPSVSACAVSRVAVCCSFWRSLSMPCPVLADMLRTMAPCGTELYCCSDSSELAVTSLDAVSEGCSGLSELAVATSGTVSACCFVGGRRSVLLRMRRVGVAGAFS